MPFGQGIFKGVEWAEWENMFDKNEEPHKAIDLKDAGARKHELFFPLRG